MAVNALAQGRFHFSGILIPLTVWHPDLIDLGRPTRIIRGGATLVKGEQNCTE